MKMIRLVVVVVMSLLFVACGGRSYQNQTQLPPPVENRALGPGDVFSMEIVGEAELPKEYEVGHDGTVQLPYVQEMVVGGLEPQQIARQIKARLEEKRILKDPVVLIRIQEINSRKITILGQVQKPGPVPYQPGLTLMEAISMAGGFNAIANRNQLKLTRQTKEKDVTVVVSAGAIAEEGAPDIQLQAGDRIYVPERVF